MRTLIREPRHPFSAAVLRGEPEAEPRWQERRTDEECWCAPGHRTDAPHDELCQRRRAGDR